MAASAPGRQRSRGRQRSGGRGAAHRNAATAAAKPLSAAGSQAQAAAGERGRRQDRYFPARLLAVIVIAALIGSALVLLLK